MNGEQGPTPGMRFAGGTYTRATFWQQITMRWYMIRYRNNRETRRRLRRGLTLREWRATGR